MLELATNIIEEEEMNQEETKKDIGDELLKTCKSINMNIGKVISALARLERTLASAPIAEGGGDVKADKKTTNTDRVLSFLRDNPGAWNTWQVAEKLGMDRAQASMTLSNLDNNIKKVIERVAKGTYRALPEIKNPD